MSGVGEDKASDEWEDIFDEAWDLAMKDCTAPASENRDQDQDIADSAEISPSHESLNEEDFELKQSRKEIDEIYQCLNAIRTTASRDLIDAVDEFGRSQQKSSNQQSLKRRRASNEIVHNETKRLKSSLELGSIAKNLKNWEQFTTFDFHAKAFQLLDLLDRENDRRSQFPPDDSYARAIEGEGLVRINWYSAQHYAEKFTDWQWYHYQQFWWTEIRRIIELKRARRRQRELANTESISESISTISL